MTYNTLWSFFDFTTWFGISNFAIFFTKNVEIIMYSGKFVFSQVLNLVNQYEFNKYVKRYNGNRHVRELDCWNLFVQLLFGQMSGLPSLRSISICLRAHEHQLYHCSNCSTMEQPVRSWSLKTLFPLMVTSWCHRKTNRKMRTATVPRTIL